MLQALKQSSEPKYLVDAATKYLRGVKGTLVQAKKVAREKAERARMAEAGNSAGPAAGQADTVEARLIAAWDSQRQ